jgi:hypothetical protein
MGEKSRRKWERRKERAAEEVTSRTPPAGVRRVLRTEVGFVCPVDGCNSPYLSYHHFDPPWKVKHHHNPVGMIALCLQHHGEADVGTYTPAQLRGMKSAGRSRTPAGRFGWRRQRMFFQGGGILAYDCPVILQARDRPVVWLTRSPAGHELLNVDLFSPRGELVFCMRDNDWLVIPPVDDIEAPPSARALKIRSKKHDLSLDLEFGDMDREVLEKMQAAGRVPPVSADADAEPFLLCTMYARLKWPIEAVLAPGQTTLRRPGEPGGFVMRDVAIMRGSIGIQIG